MRWCRGRSCGCSISWRRWRLAATPCSGRRSTRSCRGWWSATSWRRRARETGSMAAATALGLLSPAPAVGAFLASATSGWTRRVHRHGRAVILAAGAWGLAITGMGLAPGLVGALVFLTLAGGADAVSGLFRGVIWNQTIPDALRGRLASIELISYSSGPLLGDVESGAVASAFTPRVSVLSGGIICVLGVGALALALPQFRRYDARHQQQPQEAVGAA